MATISRREGLGLLVGMAAATCGGSVAAAAFDEAAQSSTNPTRSSSGAATGLNAAAKAKGMRFGSAFAYGAPNSDTGSFANPAYAALLERDCGLLVPENEMKWQALRPSATSFAFERFDAMMAYAQAKGLAVRGHNLLWHQPKWMPRWEESYDFGARPASEAARLLTTHIQTVLRRYGTRITAYDVVNEAVNNTDGTLYATALSRAMGGAEPTLDLAFHTARAEAPHAQLVYNDYMSWEPDNARHRAGVLKLLEGFKARGVPVDALGVQSHIVTQSTDSTGSVAQLQGEWRRFLDAVTAMGYKLVITELDVRDNNLPADPAARDRAVADYTRGYLDVMFAYPQLADVLVWGMSDRYSWIEGYEPRRDGAKRRPCPYDARFAAKPMRAAILEAFEATRTRAA
jgi:endo-1,4-beta-xylanase